MSQPQRWFPPAAVWVRVPATSANLGPGFDACGLALGLYDELTVSVTGTVLSIEVTGEDDGVRDETHLIVRALRAGFDALGIAPAGLRLNCVNRIPHGRGLGSSAAAIVAGLVAAGALGEGREGCGDRLSTRDIFTLACAMEGHPDNVAAALYGGFTVAWHDGDGVARVARTEPVSVLRPVAFVPARRQRTSESRVALPAGVPHADAAANAGRAALLAMAMSGVLRPELDSNRTDNKQRENSPPSVGRSGTASWQEVLVAATDDRLHQPYRLPSMPETRDLLGRLRAAGLAAVLSGSGPTVLALAVGPDQAALAGECAGDGFTVLDLPVDRDGAQVRIVTG